MKSNKQIVKAKPARIPENNFSRAHRIAKAIHQQYGGNPWFRGTEVHKHNDGFAVKIQITDDYTQINSSEVEGVWVYPVYYDKEVIQL